MRARPAFFPFLLFIALIGACTYVPRKPVYNEASLMQPLPAGLMVGPPIVESKPPVKLAGAVSPLPPVLVVPGRNLYLFGSVYYYYWDGDWFFSGARTGPWYVLPKKNYPAHVEHFQPGPETPIDIKKPSRLYPPFNK